MSMLNGSQYNEFPQHGNGVLPVNLVANTDMSAMQMGMFEKQNGGGRRGRRSRKSRRAIKGGSALSFSDFSASSAAAAGVSAPIVTIEQPLLKMPIAALSTGGKSRKLRLKKSKKGYIIGGMIPLSPANITPIDNAMNSSVLKLPVVGGGGGSVGGGKNKRRTKKSRKTRKSRKSRKSAKNMFQKLFGK